MKKIYLLSPEIKWSTFTMLQKKLVRDSGPTPKHGNRMLWEMVRDGQIKAWFDTLVDGDMMIGTDTPKIPKGGGMYVIK